MFIIAGKLEFVIIIKGLKLLLLSPFPRVAGAIRQLKTRVGGWRVKRAPEFNFLSNF